VEQGNANPSIRGAITAAMAALPLSPGASVKFPGEDGGSSLAEMAQSDLDAALQLLADRAQYITGANGAAIALRRRGKNDMQCRASAGENVPELGALLSTEYGISGESVRTRQALRCDDVERDPRVNREGCRQLGIASVVVMPVVNDDEVLGVFELFSGKVNAFGDRDLSALQRLSEMVETAVKLARAAESVPGQVETTALEPTGAAVADDAIWEDEVFADESCTAVKAGAVEESIAALEVLCGPSADAEALGEETGLPALTNEVRAHEAGLGSGLDQPPRSPSSSPVVAKDAGNGAPDLPGRGAAPAKPLFWSAAMNPVADAEKAAEPDRSHVPPVLRNLRSCEACGFPVSPGRSLCVECEEKRWRGQLKRPSAILGGRATAPVSQPPVSNSVVSNLLISNPPVSQSAISQSTPPLLAKDARNGAPGDGITASGPVARLVAAAAQSTAAGAPAPARPSISPPQSYKAGIEVAPAVLAPKRDEPRPVRQRSEGLANESKPVASGSAAAVVGNAPRESDTVPVAKMQEVATPEFVLSAGLEPSQSLLRANLFVIMVFLLVAAAAAVLVILR